MKPQTEVQITLADFTADLVEGRAKGEYAGMTRVVSVRMPIHTVVACQALADQAQVTRNSLICHLLSVGIEEVRNRLSSQTFETLMHFEAALLQSFIEEEA